MPVIGFCSCNPLFVFLRVLLKSCICSIFFAECSVHSVCHRQTQWSPSCQIWRNAGLWESKDTLCHCYCKGAWCIILKDEHKIMKHDYSRGTCKLAISWSRRLTFKNADLNCYYFCSRMVVVALMGRSSLCPPLLPWQLMWLMLKTLCHLSLGLPTLAMFTKSQCQWVWKRSPGDFMHWF